MGHCQQRYISQYQWYPPRKSIQCPFLHHTQSQDSHWLWRLPWRRRRSHQHGHNTCYRPTRPTSGSCMFKTTLGWRWMKGRSPAQACSHRMSALLLSSTRTNNHARCSSKHPSSRYRCAHSMSKRRAYQSRGPSCGSRGIRMNRPRIQLLLRLLLQ